MSPSGKGVKIFIIGDKPAGCGCKSRVVQGFRETEIYSKERFFTITGRHLSGTPRMIEGRQAPLNSLCLRLWPGKAPRSSRGGSATTRGASDDDNDVIQRAFRARNGAKFQALWLNGDTSLNGGDDSAADLALCNILVFHTRGDADQMDRLFRRSKLFREKWDERRGATTYGQMTIQEAIRAYSARVQTGARRPHPSTPREIRRDAPQLAASGLPQIVTNEGQLRTQTDEALHALLAMNAHKPVLFQRGGKLVRVRIEEPTGTWIVEEVGVDTMVSLLTRCADFIEYQTGRAMPVRPPPALARDILVQPKWQFPALMGIVDSPRIREDGTIMSKPGYDPDTKLWLTEYPGWDSFHAPKEPTSDEIRSAVATIEELLVDFPFVSPADKANAIAFMLTPILRPAIKGPVPLCAFEAVSRQGTGKTLLARTCMIVATGRDPSLSAFPDAESEMRKTILALLLAGRETVIFDNAVGLIESGAWANALTARVYDDRQLGISKQINIPVRCTWGVTGNAMTFGPDLARRTYLVTLDAGVERPEERTNFKNELPGWAEDNRLSLLRACLVLCRAYWCNGCPTPRVRRMGSFENWTEVIGGVLENAGVRGFLENQSAFRENADTDRAEWRAFLVALGALFPDQREFTTSDVVTALEQGTILRDALPAWLADAKEKELGFKTRLGKALRKHAGPVFGALRLEHLGIDKHSKKPRYRVRAATNSPEVGAASA